MKMIKAFRRLQPFNLKNVFLIQNKITDEPKLLGA